MKHLSISKSSTNNKQGQFILYLVCIINLHLWCSCGPQELEIDTDRYSVTPHLILNGIIDASKDTNAIYFSNSIAIFSPDNKEAISGWKSYGGNGFFDYEYPKIPIITNVNTQILKNGIEAHSVFEDADSVYRYVDTFQAGDRITIRGTNNNRTVDSETIIPYAPEIASIDTFAFDNSSGKQLRFLIKLKDRPAEKNFYRIMIEQYTEIHYDSAFIKEQEDFFQIKMDTVQKRITYGFKTDDPVITNGNPEDLESGIEIISFEKNYLNVFNDELFDGTEYTLNVYIAYPYSSYYLWEYETYRKTYIRLRLQAISEGLYNYYASLQRFIFLDDDMVEPVRVYSNINNGLGIWGALNETTVSIIEKEIKR